MHRRDGERKRSSQFSPKAQSVSEETICSSGKRRSRPVFLSEGSQMQSNNWAASNFEEWQRNNGRNPGSEIRRDILGSMDCHELDEVLSTFIVETRKENGEKYPPRTLYQLLSGLHRYFNRTWTNLSFVLASLPFTVFIGHLVCLLIKALSS